MADGYEEPRFIELDKGLDAVELLLSMPVFKKEYSLRASLHQMGSILCDHRERCEAARKNGEFDTMNLGFQRLEIDE